MPFDQFVVENSLPDTPVTSHVVDLLSCFSSRIDYFMYSNSPNTNKDGQHETLSGLQVFAPN